VKRKREQKKHELKEAKWDAIRQADKCKITLKEMKMRVVAKKVKDKAEKVKVKAEARPEDHARIMMMGP
jgi:isocitrate dehydrogenase kinase/phosphatase